MMNRGITLLELIVVMAVLGITLCVSLPAFSTLLQRHALVTASHELHYILRDCRQRAITRNRNVGVKFLFVQGNLLYGVFEDGNSNGLRSRDIRKGIDPMLRAYTPMQLSMGKIRPGILDENIPEITGGGKVSNPNDPVKFGRGDICSFSPLGQCSPGTLYLTDGRSLQAAVRVYGTSAMTRIMVYREKDGWVAVTK